LNIAFLRFTNSNALATTAIGQVALFIKRKRRDEIRRVFNSISISLLLCGIQNRCHAAIRLHTPTIRSQLTVSFKQDTIQAHQFGRSLTHTHFLSVHASLYICHARE